MGGFDDSIGGYPEIDHETRDSINDWCQRNNYGWGATMSKLLQKQIIRQSADMRAPMSELWRDMCVMLNAAHKNEGA